MENFDRGWSEIARALCEASAHDCREDLDLYCWIHEALDRRVLLKYKLEPGHFYIFLIDVNVLEEGELARPTQQQTDNLPFKKTFRLYVGTARIPKRVEIVWRFVTDEGTGNNNRVGSPGLSF